MKRYIKELNNDELKLLYSKNKSFQDNALNDVYEDNSEYLNEILKELDRSKALSDYSIDNSSYSYIKVSNHYDFYNNLEKVIHSYSILNYDETQRITTSILDGIDLAIARDSVKMYSTLYQELDERLDKLSKELCDIIVSELVHLLDINEDYVYDTFLNQVFEYDIYNNVYILDDTFIAYEDIRKSFE